MCPPSGLTALAPPSPGSVLHDAIPACVPSDAISQAAYSHAQGHLHPSILSHSLRVFLYAQSISRLEDTVYSDPAALEHSLLLTACMFHDMGTSDVYNTGPTRFEVEGGDAAVAFLTRFPQVTPEQRHDVWVSIAVHTSPQIAERIHPLARLVRFGPKLDFKGPRELQMLEALLGGATQCEEHIADIEERFPRNSIEKVLGDAVVDQALKCTDKAPMVSWPGVMLRSKWENVEWDGVNKAFGASDVVIGGGQPR